MKDNTLLRYRPGFGLAILLALIPCQTLSANRVIGIVAIPSLFGHIDPLGPPGQTPPKSPSAIPLRPRPDPDSAIATEATHPHQLQSAEFGYEEFGAVVYHREGPWLQIALQHPDTPALYWITVPQGGNYHPLEELLQHGLSYLSEQWDGLLYPAPGGAAATPGMAAGSISVVGSTRHEGELWLNIELLTPGPCLGPSEVIARGWVPAHNAQGEPNAWFYPRGC